MSRTPSQIERAKKTCPLCRTSPSSSAGEHVVPVTVIRILFPESAGPYTTSLPTGGLTRKQFDSIILPCCSPCNSILATRFENPGQGPALRLLADPTSVLSADEVAHAALWFLKTWLLLFHPDTEHRDATPAPDDRWDDVPAKVYSWMVSGDAPPAGLSIWAFAHDQNSSCPPDSEESSSFFEVPTIRVHSEVPIRFRAFDLTLAGVNVAVIYHPGWPIDDTLAGFSRMKRLWPVPSGQGLNGLPSSTCRPVRWRRGPDLIFSSGTDWTADLPPLAPDTEVLTLVGERAIGGALPPVGSGA